jgi:Plasmid pRiA4b ORF-3-like protein
VALGDDASANYNRGMSFDRIARVRIELDGINPPVWRRVDVPLTITMRGLHDVIQAVMPFENCHLFQFDVGDKRYGKPDPEWDYGTPMLDAKNVKLGSLVERGIVQLSYTYYFGDNWEHTVTIESTAVADPALDYPRYVEGARRAPPEDVGGIPGFEEFIKAVTKPRHPNYKRLITWYGRNFDPDDIDLLTINARIGKLVRRRTLGKAGYAKSKGSTH